ncbi:MAG: cytochrome c biogenesis protein CcsA [Sedimentisphaerales bacterium]|nr:cytochrome c biogenesis protein CcsA [Sedimentisphaerales bacterium]
MQIKANPQGYLIYAALAAYALAFLLLICRRRTPGRWLYALGFVLSVAAFGYRWHHVRHVPLQNMFEVFVCLGMVCWPLSEFCRRILDVEADATDTLIALAVLVPAGFVFTDEPQHLPPALQSWLFAPHVAVYMLAYIVMAKASVQAAAHLGCRLAESESRRAGYESATYRLICLGFPLLTLGLILGSYWGKRAWGDFWNWDSKELWSLASWLVYLGYFHFRHLYGRKYARINSVLALAGLAAIVITLSWVNLSRLFEGMHNYAA